MNRARETIQCPNCGVDQPPGHGFCTFCDATLEIPYEAFQEVMRLAGRDQDAVSAALRAVDEAALAEKDEKDESVGPPPDFDARPSAPTWDLPAAEERPRRESASPLDSLRRRPLSASSGTYRRVEAPDDEDDEVARPRTITLSGIPGADQRGRPVGELYATEHSMPPGDPLLEAMLKPRRVRVQPETDPGGPVPAPPAAAPPPLPAEPSSGGPRVVPPRRRRPKADNPATRTPRRPVATHPEEAKAMLRGAPRVPRSLQDTDWPDTSDVALDFDERGVATSRGLGSSASLRAVSRPGRSSPHPPTGDSLQAVPRPPPGDSPRPPSPSRSGSFGTATGSGTFPQASVDRSGGRVGTSESGASTASRPRPSAWPLRAGAAVLLVAALVAGGDAVSRATQRAALQGILDAVGPRSAPPPALVDELGARIDGFGLRGRVVSQDAVIEAATGSWRLSATIQDRVLGFPAPYTVARAGEFDVRSRLSTIEFYADSGWTLDAPARALLDDYRRSRDR